MSKSRKITERVLMPNDFGMLKPYCSDESIKYLKDSLARLERGRPTTVPFVLYKDQMKDDSSIDDYEKYNLSIVDKFLKLTGKLDAPDWLREYEESRLAKVGSQGGIPKWSNLKPLFLLYKTAPKEITYVDDQIIQEMKSDYRKLNCNMKSAVDVLDHLKRSDKIETRAAGWNEFQLKKTDPRAQRLALEYAKSGMWKHGVGYTFARYNKKKLRIFMPMPFSSMIKQAQYFVPFLGGIQMSLESEKHRSPFVAWSDKVGFDKCFAYMTQECREANIKSDETIVYFSNDFEKMDTRTASSQYENFFIPMLQAAFHTKSQDLHDTMIFTTTAPIFSPSGMIVGNHGTASGAEVTNGGEGCGNDYFQRRFIKVLKSILKHGWRLILRRFNGDDSALIFAITVSLQVFKDACMEALKIVCSETGWDIQFDKLDFSTEFGKYCQNVYSYDRDKREIIWMYPTVLTLNSILFPEHQYSPTEWDKDYRDLDIIVKLDNARNHPWYHELVDFVMKGMKFPLLGRSENETKRILSKYDKYRELQTLGERYNRTDYDISTSPTVKYILSKR